MGSRQNQPSRQEKKVESLTASPTRRQKLFLGITLVLFVFWMAVLVTLAVTV